MNDSLRKVHELDPDGILDHNTNEDNTTNDGSNFKKDGEATDPCHTLSSSKSEEDGSCNETEKEMDVDQPVTAAPSTAILANTHDSGSGSDPGYTGSNTGPTPTAPAATGGNIISGNKETAQIQPTINAGTGPGSGPSSGLTVNQEKGDTFNNQDWKAKIEKLIQQKKFKIPDPPKTSAEKIPSGVKEPSTMKTTDSIPAEADAVPSKTYNSILSSKKLKGKVGTIGGITSGQGSSECGSFFNKGDNRILRSVYREDKSALSVSSLSFNPSKWLCSSCPASHPVFGGGGGGSQQVRHCTSRPEFPSCPPFV
jgi:hypothetical protein